MGEESKTPDQHRSETVVLTAAEPLKALGVNEDNPHLARVGAYAVRFAGPDEKDLAGEYFTAETYFGSKNGDGADILFNHGEPIGKSAALKSIAEMSFGVAKSLKDDIGIFIETVLDLADDYQRAIYDLIEQGKLAWSTGSASHVVKKAEDGQIKRWPIIESSFTPIPCEPRLPKIQPLKSIRVDDAAKRDLKAAFTKTSGPSADDIRMQVQKAAQEDSRFNQANGDGMESCMGVWVSDLYLQSDPKTAVVQARDGKYYEVSFSNLDGKITLGSEAKEVVRKMDYVPAASTKHVDTTPAGNTTPMSEPTVKDEPKIDLAAEQKKWQEADKARKTAIRAAGKRFAKFGGNDLAEKAIDEGTSVEDFTKSLIESFNPEAIQAAPTDETKSRVEVVGERRVKSLGEALISSEAFKNFRKSGAPKNSLNLELPDASVKATFLTSTGPLTNYDRVQPGGIMVEQQRLTIADLLAQGTSDGNQIRYWKEDAYTNAATTVAEEGQKPEASWNISEVTAGFSKIAVIGRVSDELFEDFPAIRAYVDGRLRFMVEEREEAQILSGDGTGSNLTGLLNTSGIQTQAMGSDNGVIAAHKAITKVRATGKFEPDGIVVHPNDWQEMKLTMDANDQPYGGGPFYTPYAGSGPYQGLQNVWGLRAVITTAITEGTALVGAFKLGAQLFRKGGLRVDTSNSDASDFAFNRIAIRVEERVALAVYRPLAFCTVTGI